jgi:hypothetical protein
MDEEVLLYLRGQRTRIRDRIGILHAGRCWTSETLDGKETDTTAQTLEMLEDNLEEIDRLLSKAGVPLES